MKIDTEVRHVTRPGANLFLDLGFAPGEAKRLQAISRKQIDEAQALGPLILGIPVHLTSRAGNC